MLLGRDHGGASSAPNAVNFNNIGPGLGNANSNGSDVVHRHQFDRNRNARFDGLKVVYKLCKVLNGVDIVVGWRTDKVIARFAIADFGDLAGHFLAHELPAFAGFCSLSHFYLDLLAIDQILGIHAKAARGDLANPAAESALVDIAVKG